MNIMASRPSWSIGFLVVALISLFQSVHAASGDTKFISYTQDDGTTVYLRDNRKPALYTDNFGDCLGSSLINVTRFDAAYYKDNMTVLFHLAGSSGLHNESLMMYIGVYAYGESRFDLTFNPCNANIKSLCPVNSSIPIEASGIIPVNQQDVAGVPPIALTIPDFEGQAILRIFANSTETEIGCYSAVVTNGATFSHPPAVGSILGVFAFVALVASFAPAIFGGQSDQNQIPAMRTHYAHSMSVLVVFAVFQHIFFTGAMSLNWPSVLVAFWSNYAWSGGMIYAESMQNSINSFIGSNRGNTTSVGAASTGQATEGLGGGYDIHQIYGKRSLTAFRDVLKRSRFNLNPNTERVEHMLGRRALADASDGFSWYGQPVKPGLPLPGNYSGFAGTLGQEMIPASNAFMTGLLWFLILIALVAAAVVAFKWTVEGLDKLKWIRQDRLPYFRAHWVNYTVLAVLRTLFIGFFAMLFLSLFQLTWKGSAGVMAVAAIVFFIFFVGMIAIAIYACYYRIRFGNYVSEPDRLNLERRNALGLIPWYKLSRASEHQDTEKKYAGSLPFWRLSPRNLEATKSVHEDEDYTKKFGWLASRFRRTRWWFFAVWLIYEFVRACFLGGAAGQPLIQVFGLLVVELIAFVALLIVRPFEGQRLNAIVVYCLGFSNVATVGLSAAFDVQFNLARITTTVIGVVIIVIQGILTIVVMVAIVVGAATSYMSVKRDRAKEDFRPRRWRDWREKYFKHLEQRQTDLPPPPPPPPPPEPELPKEPYFSVNSVKRVQKIEDEDPEFVQEAGALNTRGSRTSVNHTSNPDGHHGAGVSTRASRAASVHSQMSYSNLPFGARPHRASWSTREFEQWNENQRMRTADSSAPLAGEPNDVSRRQSALGRDSRFMASRESLSRVGSPLNSAPASRPMTPSWGTSSHPAPMATVKKRGSWRESSGSYPQRPPLKTLYSDDAIEMVQSPGGINPTTSTPSLAIEERVSEEAKH